jgi:ABC-2 type transport system ATP-binding protein
MPCHTQTEGRRVSLDFASVSAVEVNRLRKAYRETVAVADVSFTAEAGAVTAILGPNGAGKTTTIGICCGLRRQDAGSVRVLGLDPRRDGGQLRPRLGVMPQAGGSSASGVYPAARAGEVLALFAAMYSDPLPLRPLLERLGLDRSVRTPWKRLSGGQQQRLSLALAIVGRPEVVVLDEPTSGLDVQARHATWELIRDLRSAGVAVLLSTHAMDEAESLADHVVIVDRGAVVAAGAPSELTRVEPAGRALRFDGPPGLAVAELLTALPAGSRAHEASPGHYVVEGDVDPGFVATVTSWCAGRGVMPDRLSTGGRTLEDVFLDLTGHGLRS